MPGLVRQPQNSVRDVQRQYRQWRPELDCQLMVIVSGKIYVSEQRREAFVSACLEAVRQARMVKGCLDFVVAADPLEPGHVNVYEQWESEQDLETFRGEGPGDDLTSEILDAQVMRHHIASSGPA